MNKEEITRNLKNYITKTDDKIYLTCETNTNLMARDCLNTIEQLISQLDIANKKLEDINKIVSSYGIQTIPSGLGECPVEVTAYELNNIYKLSIIGGE